MYNILRNMCTGKNMPGFVNHPGIPDVFNSHIDYCF